MSTEETKRIIEDLKNFTPEEDREIIEQLEVKMNQMFPDAQDFVLNGKKKNRQNQEESKDAECSIARDLRCNFVLNTGKFNMYPEDFKAIQRLFLHENCTEKLIHEHWSKILMRIEMLLKLNMAFFKLFKFVNHDYRLQPDTIHGQHYLLKDKIIPTLINQLVKD